MLKGHKIVLDFPTTATTTGFQFKEIFEIVTNDNTEEQHINSLITNIKKLGARLELFDPTVMFPETLWSNSTVLGNNITRTWMGAYLVFGALWHKKVSMRTMD